MEPTLKVALELLKLTPDQANLVREALTLVPSLFAYGAAELVPILQLISDQAPKPVAVAEEAPTPPRPPVRVPSQGPARRQPVSEKRDYRTLEQKFPEAVLAVGGYDLCQNPTMSALPGWYGFPCKAPGCQQHFLYPKLGERIYRTPERCLQHMETKVTRERRLEVIQKGVETLGNPIVA